MECNRYNAYSATAKSDVMPLVETLEATFSPERISTSPGDLRQHGHDESAQPEHLPDVVVWPHTTAEVSATLRLANEARIPVTPWGAGTSLEGNPIPLRGVPPSADVAYHSKTDAGYTKRYFARNVYAVNQDAVCRMVDVNDNRLAIERAHQPRPEAPTVSVDYRFQSDWDLKLEARVNDRNRFGVIRFVPYTAMA